MPAIVRNARTGLYATTITVYAGITGDCIAPLPDGIMLTAGGGTAPQKKAARAVFRISGTGIDGPGGINIGVAASPISANVPETEDLRSAAFLSLPPSAMLVRYDPFSNSCTKAAIGPQGNILRQWGHGSFCAWEYGDSSRDVHRKLARRSCVDAASATPELSPCF